MRLFTKYDASGTVDHMSMNGWKVMVCGHQVKAAWTSDSGFTDDVTMTYSGTTVKTVSTAMVTHRKTWDERVSRIAVPPVHDEKVGAGDHQQEQQQQHAHRGAGAEVPGQERRVVDVEGDQVSARWLRGAPEQYERCVEVVEGPQEHDQQQDRVDRPQHGQRDRVPLAERLGAVDGGRFVHLGGDGLQTGHQHQERERPEPPDRD